MRYWRDGDNACGRLVALTRGILIIINFTCLQLLREFHNTRVYCNKNTNKIKDLKIIEIHVKYFTKS